MSRQVTTRQGDVIDQIALKFYGRTDTFTEVILNANPHLADLDAILPAGVVVTLPDLPATPTRQRLKLWE